MQHKVGWLIQDLLPTQPQIIRLITLWWQAAAEAVQLPVVVVVAQVGC
jgi:hypothetical protein